MMLPPSTVTNAPEPMQPVIVTRAYEQSPHRTTDVVGTTAPRTLAAAGWVGCAIGYAVAALILSKSYRHITSDNWRDALREIRWLMPLMVSAFGLAYLGWIVWTTLAAINGHRVAPMASSPWLPPMAYLMGPVLGAAGALYKPEMTRGAVVGAVAWVCIGHGFVLLSLRSSARRIGADSREFTKLIWFPLASLGYRIIATTVLPSTSFDSSTIYTAMIAIDVTLMLAGAFAAYRAMHSFDLACSRDRYSSVANQLPAFMASAHRS